MSWTVLVNTDGQHFKFWSFQGAERRSGRIGSAGLHGNYSESENIDKMYEKLQRGYVIFSRNFPTHQPNAEQVRNFNADRLGTSSNTPVPNDAPRTSRRTPARPASRPTPRTRTVTRRVTGVQAIEVPTLERSHTVPSVDTYRTDAKGFVNYRKGFSKNTFDKIATEIQIMRINSFIDSNGRNIFPANLRPYYEKAKTYFNHISSDTQYNKPSTFEGMRDASRPTFFLVFRVQPRNVECIGIFNLHRGQGYCDFFAIKTDVTYRTTLIKKIILSQAHIVGSTLTYKIKKATMKNQIKSIANFAIEENTTTLKYRTIDLKNGINLPQSKPARWID